MQENLKNYKKNMISNLKALKTEREREIKELATKTVEATGGVKIIGNNQNDNK